MVSAAERGSGGDGGLSLLFFFFVCLGSAGSQSVHSVVLSFFFLSAGTKGSGWELRHLTGSPGGGGALDSVIL